MRVRYTGAQITVCEHARSLPNPPTGDGANVEGWDFGTGGIAIAEFELTLLAGADVALAAGAMLIAEEVFDTHPEESIAVTLTNGTEIVNLATHGFQSGDGPVRLSGTLPAQLSLTTEYYVIKVAAGTFKLAASRALALAGTAVAFGSDGVAVFVHWVTGTKSTEVVYTANFTTNVMTATDHGLTTGDVVTVLNTGGIRPDPLVAATDYYAIVLDDDTFKLATTAPFAAAGTAIDLIDAGTGTNSAVVPNTGATSGTTYVMFSLLNGGDAIDLTANIGYRERISHRPGIVAYHLVATLDDFVPLTSYVRGVLVE